MLSKKFKNENEFYINKKTGKVQFCKLCNNCQNDCKQSFDVEVLRCYKFVKKVDNNGRKES